MKLSEVVSKLKNEIQAQDDGSDATSETLQISLEGSGEGTKPKTMGGSNEENCPPVGVTFDSSSVRAFGVKVNGTSQWKLMQALASEGHVCGCVHLCVYACVSM